MPVGRHPPFGQLRAFRECGEFGICDLRTDRSEAGKDTETAACDDAIRTHDIRKTPDVLCDQFGMLDEIGRGIDETKAIETAAPLAKAVRYLLEVREMMHENDRTATGFLPSNEFEAVADQFFAHPDDSVRGWETARAVQSRIVAEVKECLEKYRDGDLLFVDHGGVGSLLFCHL